MVSLEHMERLKQVNKQNNLLVENKTKIELDKELKLKDIEVSI